MHRTSNDFMAFTRSTLTWLHREAYRMCGDWHEAEDLSQDVLVAMYRRWEKLDDRQRLTPYVRHVLRNTFLSERRRLRHHMEDLSGTIPEPATEPVDPDTGIALSMALDGLVAEQRDVVFLRFWKELSIDEISATTGTSKRRVSTHVHNALGRLRMMLE